MTRPVQHPASNSSARNRDRVETQPRPEYVVKAEALREARAEIARMLDTFPAKGRHTRARWAVVWLDHMIDRADRLATDTAPAQPDAALSEGEREAQIRRELTRRAGLSADEAVALEAARWVAQIERDYAARAAHPATDTAAPEGANAAREVVTAVLAELPMSADGTGHIVDCGYTEAEPTCGCYTLPERIRAAVGDRSVGPTEQAARAAAQRIYNHGGYHGSAAAIEDAMRAFVNGARWAAAPAAPEGVETVEALVEFLPLIRDFIPATFEAGDADTCVSCGDGECGGACPTALFAVRQVMEAFDSEDDREWWLDYFADGDSCDVPPQQGVETVEYREQAEATIADLRARASHYEALLVAVREETVTKAALAVDYLYINVRTFDESWDRGYRQGVKDAAYAVRELRAQSTPVEPETSEPEGGGSDG